MTEYPTTKVGFDGNGWALNLQDNSYLRAPSLASTTLYTDASGWFYSFEASTPIKPVFKWPEAKDTPDPSSYNYTRRNPTRYSWAEGGRGDVEAWAHYLISNFDVSVNTYHHHPEEVWINRGISREYDSLDVWGPGGRGYALDADLGDEIFGVLFNDPDPPDIEWIIYKGVMYGAWNGWEGEPFGSDDFSWHYDHIHVTYRKL